MQVDILHDMDYTGDGVTVAIVDSGCVNHSYFLDTILRYNQVNGDGNISSTTSWSSNLLNDASPIGHGTKMVGGVKQFAPSLDLVFYECFDSDPAAKLENYLWALEDLVENYVTWGVDILSLSWGSSDVSQRNQTVVSDVEDCLDTLVTGGVTIFIASGNENAVTVSWPAYQASNYSGIMSIGAVFDSNYGDYHEDQRWVGVGEGSNYGDDLELMAAGTYITTTNKNGSWEEVSGTSISTVIAAGLTACLIEQYSDVPSSQRPATITPSFIEGRLRENAEILYENGTATEYGDGVIRAAASMLNWKDYANSKTDTYGTVVNFINLAYGNGSATFQEDLDTWTDWTVEDTEDFSSGIPGDWTVSPSGSWYHVSSGGQSGGYAKMIGDEWGGPTAGTLISKGYDTFGADRVKVEFYYKTSRFTENNFKVYVKDMWDQWDLIFTLDDSTSWVKKTWTSTWSAYSYYGFQVKYVTNDMDLSALWVGVDTHVVSTGDDGSSYRFQHNFVWSGLDISDYCNTSLCLNITSHSGSEYLIVECFHNSSWVELSSTVSQANYSFAVGNYITGTTFTVRIRGASESSDASQDTWTVSHLYLMVLDTSISYYDP
jgi:hypothetical protein